MVSFSTIIKKFDNQGEKTGWTYIEVPAKIAGMINPGVKKSFQIKGKLDDYKFRALNLLPMGDGDFILALNSEIRKKINKRKGDNINVSLELDKVEYKINADLLTCLADEPEADAAFQKMPNSHQKYYSRWIESAKTEPTKTKRIAMTVDAMLAGLDYGAMLRKARDEKEQLGF